MCDEPRCDEGRAGTKTPLACRRPAPCQQLHSWDLTHRNVIRMFPAAPFLVTPTRNYAQIPIHNRKEALCLPPAVGRCAVLSLTRLLATLRSTACQAPLSVEFFRQDYRRGLPFPTPGDPPDPGIKLASLVSPELVGGFFISASPGKIWNTIQSQKRVYHQLTTTSAESVLLPFIWDSATGKTNLCVKIDQCDNQL